MAFPQVAAYNGGAEVANATDHTVNLPSGIGVGDLLLIIIASDGTPTFTWPTGWTQLFQTAVGCALGTCYRVADGSEGASVIVKTSASEQVSYVTYRIEGHSSSTNPPQGGSSVSGTSANPNPYLVTPTGGAKDYLWLALEGNDHLDLVSAYPTNYGNGLNYNGGGPNSCGVGVARRELNAASEDPGDYTLAGSEEWVTKTIAVHPGSEGFLQTISAAGAIASGEAFGTPTVVSPQVISNAGAIASLEAFGTSNLIIYLLPSGISSSEAFGNPTVSIAGQFLLPSSIVSQEAFGVAKVNLAVLPSGISSLEAFGTATVSTGAQFLQPSSITSEEAFGTSKLNLQIVATGIASAEAFGSANIAITQFLQPSSIVSAEAFGNAKLILFLVASGIPPAEAFGSPSLSLKISPPSIVSAEAFGTLQLNLAIIPTGISSAEVFGSPKLNLLIVAVGVGSEEAFGAPTIAFILILQPTGIGTGEAFGAPSLKLYIVASGIVSGELFGFPTITMPLILSPEGIVSAEMLEKCKVILWARITQAELDSIRAKLDALLSTPPERVFSV